jgi:hypothetical protein
MIFYHLPGTRLTIPVYPCRSLKMFGWVLFLVKPVLVHSTMILFKYFITVFAAKYDGDSRIGYMQAGLLGFWSEYHVLRNPFLPECMMGNVTTWFKHGLKKMPLMVRYTRHDSYSFSTLDGATDGGTKRGCYYWPKILAVNHSDVWRYAPLGEETRPDNAVKVFTVEYPAGIIKMLFGCVPLRYIRCIRCI